MKKKCKCGWPVKPGSRYCKVCEDKIKRQMRRDGYLTPKPHNQTGRGVGARENVLETRHGVDS